MDEPTQFKELTHYFKDSNGYEWNEEIKLTHLGVLEVTWSGNHFSFTFYQNKHNNRFVLKVISTNTGIEIPFETFYNAEKRLGQLLEWTKSFPPIESLND